MTDSRPFVSLCMIVRDEEAYLRRCLESFHGVYDELIVVDTGSQDRTIEIAQGFGAHVECFKWCDDFGTAKNFACSLAEGQWIVMPDGDEYLGPDGIGPRVQEMLRQVPERVDKLLIEQRTLLGEDVITLMVDRIFRNRPDLRWKYRIHEVIETHADRTAMTRDFYLLHENKLKRRENGMRVSDEREQMYLRALALDAEDYPDDPRPVFYLAETLYGAKRHQEALEVFASYFALSEGTEPFRRAVAFRDAAAAAGAMGQQTLRRSFLFRSLKNDWRQADTYVALADMALEYNNRDEAIHWLTVATGCRSAGCDGFSTSSAHGPHLKKRLAKLLQETKGKARSYSPDQNILTKSSRSKRANGRGKKRKKRR